MIPYAPMRTDKSPETLRDCLTPREVSLALGVHPQTVYAWCRKGEIRARQIGRKWFIPRSIVKELLKSED